MKKNRYFYLIALLIAMSLVFAACNNSEDDLIFDDEFGNEDIEAELLEFSDVQGTYYVFDEEKDSIDNNRTLTLNEDGTWEYSGKVKLSGAYEFDTSQPGRFIGKIDGKEVMNGWYSAEAEDESSAEPEAYRAIETEWKDDFDGEFSTDDYVGFFNTEEAAIAYGYSASAKILGTWLKENGDEEKLDDYITFNPDGSFENGSPYIEGLEGQKLGEYQLEGEKLTFKYSDGHTEAYSLVFDKNYIGDIAEIRPESGTGPVWVPTDFFMQ